LCWSRLTQSTSPIRRAVLASTRTPSIPFFTVKTNASYMALKYLLEKQEALSEAVNDFTSPVNDAAQSDDDAMEKSLWKSWNELIETAATTPHPQQEPLVEFVEKLREELSPKKANGESCKIWGNTVEWKNLPLLGPALREAWNNIPLDSEAGKEVEKWVNMNAFVARITSISSSSDPLDFSLYGVWAMRAVLEDRNPEAKMPPPHSIEAASVWMVYASGALWKRSVAEHVYDGKIAREGTTLTGKEWTGCCKERWALWKLRFAQIWERYEEGDIKGLVEKASQEMARVERE